LNTGMPASYNVAFVLGIYAHVAAGAISNALIRDNATTTITSAGAAALAACIPSSPHGIMLTQGVLRGTKRSGRRSDAILQSFSFAKDANGAAKFLDSISEEILALQYELDDSHLECEVQKKAIEQRISQFASSSSQMAQDVSSMEAKIAAASAQLQPITEKIQMLRDEIQKDRTYCEKEGEVLNTTEMPEMIRVMKSQRLQTQCRSNVRSMNDQLRERVAALSRAQAALTQAVSMKTQFNLQMTEADKEMARLVEASKTKEQECKESLTQYQREMCGLTEMRQAIYWEFIDNDENKVIQDCQVSDWTAGQCSKTCMKDLDDAPGVQILTRTEVSAGSQYGMECPTLSRNITCNANVECPVDCKMGEWTGWAKCSRRCGGGEQYRTRSALSRAKAGGSSCGPPVETKLCNVGACQADCTFGDWGAWGPCSKRCKWTSETKPGHTSRKRPVASEMTPGSCKDTDALEHEECNVEECPKDLAKLNCKAPQDVLVVLDGSDSAGDANGFDNAKKLVAGLIKHSSFATDGSLLRYALVLFGTGRAQVLSPMIANQEALLGAVSAATFSGGHADVGQALITAAQVSQLATVGDRPVKRETVILITGNTLHRKAATSTAARRLRDIGTRVIVLQVGDTSEDPVIQGDEAECELVSAPCEDNWLRVGSWSKVGDAAELGFYLSAVCPQ